MRPTTPWPPTNCTACHKRILGTEVAFLFTDPPNSPVTLCEEHGWRIAQAPRPDELLASWGMRPRVPTAADEQAERQLMDSLDKTNPYKHHASQPTHPNPPARSSPPLQTHESREASRQPGSSAPSPH